MTDGRGEAWIDTGDGTDDRQSRLEELQTKVRALERQLHAVRAEIVALKKCMCSAVAWGKEE